MSEVAGQISVSVGFSDVSSQPTKVVSKQVLLEGQEELSSGKVAIVSGTVGTTLITVTPAYRNASGEPVSFASGIDRVCLKTDSSTPVTLTCGSFSVVAKNGAVSVSETPGGATSFTIRADSGTADYLVIAYADESLDSARNLYFNAAADNEWTTLGNWWVNESCSEPSPILPRSIDSVFILDDVLTNASSEPYVVNLTASGSAAVDISVTVSGVATFNDSSVKAGTSYPSIIHGDAVFNDSSVLEAGADINGQATFNDNSSCQGTVAGDAIFNDSSTATGAFVNVVATGYFNDASCTDGVGQFGATVPDPPPTC